MEVIKSRYENYLHICTGCLLNLGSNYSGSIGVIPDLKIEYPILSLTSETELGNRISGHLHNSTVLQCFSGHVDFHFYWFQIIVICDYSLQTNILLLIDTQHLTLTSKLKETNILPCHADIMGNERTDELEKLAASMETKSRNMEILISNINYIKQACKIMWTHEWKTQLHEIFTTFNKQPVISRYIKLPKDKPRVLFLEPEQVL